MSLSFGITEFTSFVEVLLSVVFVLAGFMLAAFSLGFKREVKGKLQEGTVQKSFDYRNESRTLLGRFLCYGGLLVVVRLASAAIEVQPSCKWADLLLLLLSIALLIPMLWLLWKTYKFYWDSTAIKGTGII